MNISMPARTVIFGLLLTLALGCSARGRSISKNAICPSNYDPMSVTDNKKFGNKLELKPGEPFAQAAGDYAYNGSELYYFDVDRNIKIHLAQSTSASGEPKLSILCVGGDGISQSMTPVTFSIPVVSDILVTDTQNTKIRSRIFSFDLRPRAGQAPLHYSVDLQDPDFVDGAPQESYQDYTEVAQIFATVAGAAPTYQLVANLKDVRPDEKSGKNTSVIVRTLVNMKPISADDRKKIDDSSATISNFSSF